jgi:ribosomal protein S27AE
MVKTNTEYNKKYYEVNKEKIRIKQAEYRVKNKEKILSNNGEKIVCKKCGKLNRKDNINRHMKSAKCRNFISPGLINEL